MLGLKSRLNPLQEYFSSYEGQGICSSLQEMQLSKADATHLYTTHTLTSFTKFSFCFVNSFH